MKPYEVEILVGEVDGERRARRSTTSCSTARSPTSTGFVAIGGHAEELDRALQRPLHRRAGISPTAVKTAVEVLAAHPESRTIEADAIEAGVPRPHPVAPPQVPPARGADEIAAAPGRLRPSVVPAFPRPGVGCRSWTGASSGSRTSTASPARSGAAAAVARRGRAVPVPPGRALGPVLERLPRERRPALPRRRLASRVRDARMRRRQGARGARQGGGAHPRSTARARPRSACTRRASRARSTCSRTTPTRRATPTAATRTTWSPGTGSSPGWPTC